MSIFENEKKLKDEYKILNIIKPKQILLAIKKQGNDYGNPDRNLEILKLVSTNNSSSANREINIVNHLNDLENEQEKKVFSNY